jgi:hypothetical protein
MSTPNKRREPKRKNNNPPKALMRPGVTRRTDVDDLGVYAINGAARAIAVVGGSKLPR